MIDMSQSKRILASNFDEAAKVLEQMANSADFMNAFDGMSEAICSTIEKGGVIYICGNGGSHCDAMHFAEELTGRFRKDRKPLGALALGDAPHLTCVSNDMGFEHVFSRQVEGLGRAGDLLIGISTSGNSANVREAVLAARKKGLRTVGLLGKDGGMLKGLVDIAVVVPSKQTERIQEAHIKLIHSTIEVLERRVFPENY